MKSTTIVCALVVLACLCLQAQGETKGQAKDQAKGQAKDQAKGQAKDQAKAVCEVDGEKLTPGVHYRKCVKITCNADGSMSGLGCAESRCRPGKQTGFQKADFTKPYPQCCARPICAP